MSDENWLTVSELAERFGIPQPTIRRYIERHGHHLRIKKHHKSYLIAESSLDLLIQIREGYSAGKNADQIENGLDAVNAPTIIDVSGTSERVSAITPEALSRLHSTVIEGFERQDDFNRSLLKALKLEHEENQKQREEDRKQIQRLTTILSQQQEAAAAALPDTVQLRNERVNERLTERRIERQLEAEALDLWGKKPESERMRRIGLFRKEEDAVAKAHFVRQYVDEHFEKNILKAYGLE